MGWQQRYAVLCLITDCECVFPYDDFCPAGSDIVTKIYFLIEGVHSFPPYEILYAVFLTVTVRKELYYHLFV